LIGFAGAPWTLLAYMIEGGGSKTFSKARKFLYLEPAAAHSILNKIADSTITYLKRQIQAGADLVQIFDSWAGILPPAQYHEFSLHYIEKIAAAITEVPVTVFAKGAWFALKDMSRLSCETIGLDWNMSPGDGIQQIPDKTLQGNLDPCLLYASPDTIKRETFKMLSQFGDHPHIANLGHGVYPDTNPDNVKVFIEAVKSWK
jgi:uroporphyrinogen decarboxylase